VQPEPSPVQPERHPESEVERIGEKNAREAEYSEPPRQMSSPE